MENIIKLKERKDILKLGIMDEKGNIVKDDENEEVFIEFDLGDIELPIKYNNCINMIEQARKNLKNQFFFIDKKQDHKGKQLLSANEEAKMKALHKFYVEMQNAMDSFLGDGGTKKFLNGKKPYWEMWDDLTEALEPHLDKMELKVTDMATRIAAKYKKKSSSEVLSND